jgi:hypothetical protein
MIAPGFIQRLGDQCYVVVDIERDTLTLHERLESARLHLAVLDQEAPLLCGEGCTGYGPRPGSVCDLCHEAFTTENPEHDLGCCARCWATSIDIGEDN